ncbi:MAG: UDP-4-amino-4,6-dideoxy-N-acetyl-beta-L-altrosamine transaminase [Deltaproteobacteria bacterium]|nr:UDP-4-amino-4,6-dideoxy-N-acetyl-beta-L-altrosamine transaminase [Deltaproteobacteria bacterium]
MKTIIPYGRQSINEEDIREVCAVLRSDWLTQGPKVKEFEDALAEQCGASHCILVSNGTVALHLACLALEIGPGDIGLTSPISFLASANCIAFCGGTPDFADIKPKTLCLSPERVEEYCETQNIPKVVIPVDFAGVPADLPRFRGLSEKYGFKLIEDAAHAIGSAYQYDGKEYYCGSCAHTDISVFSFHPVKTITSGEGGAILTNDDKLADKLRHFANHGIEKDPEKFINQKESPEWYHEMHSLGYNGRITDIQCALGLSQLKRLNEFKNRRQEIVKEYNHALRELEEGQIIILPPWPEETDPCYHLYPIRLGPNSKIKRDDLYMQLRDNGIYCQIHYIPIYRQPFYQERYNYNFDRFPEAEKYYDSCISLPLFPDMDDKTIKFITGSVTDIIT